MQKQGQMQNLLCVYEFICMKMAKDKIPHETIEHYEIPPTEIS